MKDIRAFWNKQADLGILAGTRDVIAKRLEMAAIAKYVRGGQEIMDLGCGNGITAIYLAKLFKVNILGIDFAERMVRAAKDLVSRHKLMGSISLETGDIKTLNTINQKFDLIYTERLLINLPDWESQRNGIGSITDHLVQGGRYLMCENSMEGLERMNALRLRVGLQPIRPPWHNRYLREKEVAEARLSGVTLEKIDFYSSTYYFLSRIVNAWISARRGKEPSYHSWINRLALIVPSIGKFGQGRIWVWRRTGS